MTENLNCDNNKCVDSEGEVRRLPIGGDSAVIVCRNCFGYEINFRRARNLELSKDCAFDLPKWEELEIYIAE